MIKEGRSIEQLQSLPLEAKVKMSTNRIKAWHQHWDGQVFVAFSAGLDSTVLLDLVRREYDDVPAVFYDTGMEFPENRKFAKEMGAIFRRPRKTFREVIDQYGYPVVSKRVASHLYDVQVCRPDCETVKVRLTGMRSNGDFTRLGKIPDKWMFLVDAPFKVSHRCCHWLKKLPAKEYEKETGRRAIVGVRVEESQNRRLAWMKYGCNAIGGGHTRSWPMSFWTATDVREYIAVRKLQYSSLYDMGYSRSGCMFCLFGIHMETEPNKLQTLYHTHPKIWRYCMTKLGYSAITKFMGIETTPQPNLVLSCANRTRGER